MAPRRRRRRPWYRTRAYRLTRTALLTVVLVTVGVRCTGDHKSTAPGGPYGPDTVAAAGPDAEVAAGPDAEVAAGPDAEVTHGPDSDVAAGPDADVARGSDAEGTRGPGAEVTRGSGAEVTRGSGAAVTHGPAPSVRPTPTRTSPLRPLPRSRPTSFRIPSLGIDAPITGLGLNRGRELATPPVDKPKLVGWYQGGPTPGEPGTAIAVGHRDTRTGPAVFAALAQVKPGKVIEAGRADGRTAVYTVDRVKVFDKEGFPDKEVYGPARRPELRVITCGGLFKWRTGYTSNVVVFAHLTQTREPRPTKSATAR
ncbi:class F sortase [Streptomyces canus]|uniref:class F sortase n=1 Tax=Streptomyces canus TaxID=58343 RepID=UPI0022504634|nr:class F sortase [Streptomyces canus]MCX5260802.1 class F sortase [Streptomyces canus]